MDRDRELFAFLESKFEGIDRRLAETQEQIRENRTLIEDTRNQVRENRTLIQGNRTLIEDTRNQVRENRTEIRENRDRIRGTHVVAEDLRSKLQILAEGHIAQDEKIDRRFDQAETGRREDRDHLEAMIKGVFVNLDRRDDGLEERIERLEAVG